MDQQIGGTLGIAVSTSIYALAAVQGQYVSGLPTAFTGGALIALMAALGLARLEVARGETTRFDRDRSAWVRGPAKAPSGAAPNPGDGALAKSVTDRR
jgi:hypothetical protein